MIFPPLKRVLSLLAAACLLYGGSPGSFAGYRDDRLVVWVNLEGSADSFNVDETVAGFISSRRVDSECGVHWRDWGSTLYMKKRPDKITNDLVQKAFIDGDGASLGRLNHLLKSFRDPGNGVKNGLDGVMVYSNKNGPHMMNFITGGKKIKSYPLTSDGTAPTAHDVEEAFCILLPPTTRAP